MADALTTEATDANKLCARWIEEIEAAEKGCASWWRSGDVIIRRYKNEIRNGRGGANANVNPIRRFAILWSNIQTLAPAIYAKRPVPEVSRRFNDPDPVGKIAADVLERALAYSLESYDFDGRMQLCRNDYLLTGRGQLWARYVPHIREVDAGDVEKDEGVETEGGADGSEPGEEVEYEEVLCDHVAWKDFLTNPTREWAETRWVSRRVFMTRAELKKRFGDEIGKAVPLDGAAKTGEDGADREGERDASKKAQVYEIWDITTRKAYWVSKSYPTQCLDVRDDPLGLREFFPCPPPLNATVGPDSTIPVPDYVQYQDQADELDDLTQRIGKLQNALRMVGVYAGEANVTLQNVFTPGNENALIPIDAYDLFKENGGIRGLIEWVPIDMVMQCLKGCYDARAQVISDIYQITGMSDIIRGESNPNETATAQAIKAQYGSLRVRDRQKDVQKFARSAIEIKAEIIAEHFSIETLKAMTNVKLMTNAEKQAVQMQMQQQAMIYQGQAQAAQAQGVQPPTPPEPDPEIMDLLEQPSWEDVKALLSNDAMRSFRIDIETDSTIEPDETAQKQAFTEYVGSITQLMQVASVILPSAPYVAPLFAEIFKQSARVFKVSRTLEDTIDKVFETAEAQPPAQPAGPPQPEPPDESAIAVEQLKSQTAQMQAQIEQQRTQMEGQLGMAELNLKGQELQVKAAALSRDPTPQGVA
jgi:hypothetical protein